MGLLALSLLTILPVGGVLLFGLSVARQNTRDLTLTLAEASIARLSEGVRRELDPIVENAAYLSDLTASGRLDPFDDKALESHLMAAFGGLPQVSDLAFIDTEGRVTSVNRARQRVTHARWADDERVMASLQEGAGKQSPYWSGFIFAERARSTRLELRAPLRQNGRYVGLLISVVTTSGLSQLVSRVGDAMEGQGFLLSGTDLVVAHPRLVQPVGNLSGSHPLPGIDEVDDPILAAMWRNRHQHFWRYHALETGQSHVASIDGVDYLYLYRELDSYGREPWLIGLYRPLADLERPFRRLWLLLGAGGTAVIFTAFGFWLIGRKVTLPLERLSERAARIRNFDWSGGAIPSSPFRELHQAARAFNALAEGLAKAATYLPNHLVRRLLQEEASGAPLTGIRDVTVMFTDIVGFSAGAAGLTPDETMAELNAHFSLLVPCVEKNAGTVDKFIGDGLMAFWGAPEQQPDHAERALCAALDIQSAVDAENHARRARGKPAIRLRIGLHSGPALVGNIGATGRIDYTVIGDTVNIAQRLEALARNFMADKDIVVVLLSGQTLQRIGPGLESFSLGPHVVPGHGGEVELFRLA